MKKLSTVTTAGAVYYTMVAISLCTILAISLASCTDNVRARWWGGTEDIDLPVGERIVNVTWKQNDLWILTRTDTTKPASYTFSERSSFGVLEGQVIINEK